MSPTIDTPVPKSFILRQIEHYRTIFVEDLTCYGDVYLDKQNVVKVSLFTVGNRSLSSRVLVWLQDQLKDKIQDEINGYKDLPFFMYAINPDFSVCLTSTSSQSSYEFEGVLHLYHALPNHKHIMIREAMGSKKGFV